MSVCSGTTAAAMKQTNGDDRDDGYHQRNDIVEVIPGREREAKGEEPQRDGNGRHEGDASVYGIYGNPGVEIL